MYINIYIYSYIHIETIDWREGITYTHFSEVHAFQTGDLISVEITYTKCCHKKKGKKVACRHSTHARLCTQSASYWAGKKVLHAQPRCVETRRRWPEEDVLVALSKWLFFNGRAPSIVVDSYQSVHVKHTEPFKKLDTQTVNFSCHGPKGETRPLKCIWLGPALTSHRRLSPALESCFEDADV